MSNPVNRNSDIDPAFKARLAEIARNDRESKATSESTSEKADPNSGGAALIVGKTKGKKNADGKLEKPVHDRTGSNNKDLLTVGQRPKIKAGTQDEVKFTADFRTTKNSKAHLKGLAGNDKLRSGGGGGVKNRLEGNKDNDELTSTNKGGTEHGRGGLGKDKLDYDRAIDTNIALEGGADTDEIRFGNLDPDRTNGRFVDTKREIRGRIHGGKDADNIELGDFSGVEGKNDKPDEEIEKQEKRATIQLYLDNEDTVKLNGEGEWKKGTFKNDRDEEFTSYTSANGAVEYVFRTDRHEDEDLKLDEIIEGNTDSPAAEEAPETKDGDNGSEDNSVNGDGNNVNGSGNTVNGDDNSVNGDNNDVDGDDNTIGGDVERVKPDEVEQLPETAETKVDSLDPNTVYEEERFQIGTINSPLAFLNKKISSNRSIFNIHLKEDDENNGEKTKNKPHSLALDSNGSVYSVTNTNREFKNKRSKNAGFSAGLRGNNNEFNYRQTNPTTEGEQNFSFIGNKNSSEIETGSSSDTIFHTGTGGRSRAVLGDGDDSAMYADVKGFTASGIDLGKGKDAILFKASNSSLSHVNGEGTNNKEGKLIMVDGTGNSINDVRTGAGNDDVLARGEGNAFALIDLGAGDDRAVIASKNTNLSKNGGSFKLGTGDDEITLAAEGITGTVDGGDGKLTVNASLQSGQHTIVENQGHVKLNLNKLDGGRYQAKYDGDDVIIYTQSNYGTYDPDASITLKGQAKGRRTTNENGEIRTLKTLNEIDGLQVAYDEKTGQPDGEHTQKVADTQTADITERKIKPAIEKQKKAQEKGIEQAKDRANDADGVEAQELQAEATLLEEIYTEIQDFFSFENNLLFKELFETEEREIEEPETE